VREFYISKKETRSLVEEIKSKLKADLSEIKDKGNKVIELEKEVRFFVLENLIFIREGENIFPALSCTKDFLERFPSVNVDKGAIPYICNGAKIMRPGIVGFEKDFKIDDIVLVKDSVHNKFIAVGKALIEKSEAEKSEKGATLENLHYIGDKHWKALKDYNLG